MLKGKKLLSKVVCMLVVSSLVVSGALAATYSTGTGSATFSGKGTLYYWSHITYSQNDSTSFTFSSSATWADNRVTGLTLTDGNVEITEMPYGPGKRDTVNLGLYTSGDGTTIPPNTVGRIEINYSDDNISYIFGNNPTFSKSGSNGYVFVRSFWEAVERGFGHDIFFEKSNTWNQVF